MKMADEFIENICRTCLEKSSDMISLAADHVVCNKVMSLLELIKICTSAQINLGDIYPQFVCFECIRSAEKSYEFRFQCEQSDEKLRSQSHVTLDLLDFKQPMVVELTCDGNVIKSIEDSNEALEFKEVVIETETYQDDDDDEEMYETETLDEEIEIVDESINAEVALPDSQDSSLTTNDTQVLTDNNEVAPDDCQNASENIQLEAADSQDEAEVEENLSEEEVPKKMAVTFNCRVCNLIFPTALALMKHSTTHPPIFYQCPHCPVRFISCELFKKHVVKHTLKKNVPDITSKFMKRPSTIDYTCNECGEKFISYINLRSHIDKHRKTKNEIFTVSDDDENNVSNYTCSICNEVCTDVNALRQHKMSAHKPKFRCKHCFESFTNLTALQHHLGKHTEERKPKAVSNTIQNKIAYKCKICSSEVDKLTGIKSHLALHNIDGKSIFQHLMYKCNDCLKEFETIYSYFEHTSDHPGQNIDSTTGDTMRIMRSRPYKCCIADCEKSFPTPSALKKHAKTHQSQWPKKCRYCDEIVNKWHDYMLHLNNMHESEKTFICSQCGKKFFKERNLQSHVKTHSGERNYMCDYCGWSFHALNNLVAHRRIHTGVTPYKCTICPKAFAQHAGLRSHLLNHSGERKHECQTCHKKFLRVGALNNHIKTHTGVKDYACHICGAMFGASSTRKKHLLTHTGERNHVCDFCGKAFSRRSNLSVHRKIHTGETPHVCDVCGKGFIQAHVLRSHMNTHRKAAAGLPVRRTTRKISPPQIIKEEQNEFNEVESDEMEQPEEVTVYVQYETE